MYSKCQGGKQTKILGAELGDKTVEVEAWSWVFFPMKAKTDKMPQKSFWIKAFEECINVNV